MSAVATFLHTLQPQKAHTATAGSSIQCVHHRSSSSTAPIGVVTVTSLVELLTTVSAFLYTGLIDPSASSRLSYLSVIISKEISKECLYGLEALSYHRFLPAQLDNLAMCKFSDDETFA